MWRVVLVLLGLAAGGAGGPLPAQADTEATTPTAAHPAVTPAAAPARKFTQGEVLYMRHCAGCHGWQGEGTGPVAQMLEIKPPSLRRAELFTQNTEAELVARILLGKNLPMSLAATSVVSSEAQVTALLSYLRRLPTVDWKKVHAAEDAYDSLCVSCHGVYGRGDGPLAASLSPRPRDLSDPAYQSQVNDQELFRIISAGKGSMPGTKDVLSEKGVRAVSAFVRVLSPGYETYDRFCASCHGPDGRPAVLAVDELLGTSRAPGERPPVFDQAYMRAHTDEQLRAWVRHMLKENQAGMPHFAGSLNAEQVRQILTYLRNLPPAP